MKRGLFLGVMLIAALLFANHEAGAYTVWDPTTNISNLISLEFPSGSPYQVYLYDPQNPSALIKIMDSGSLAINVTFSESGGDWYATPSIGGNLNLGPSDLFGLFFRPASGGDDIYTYSYTLWGTEYKLTVNSYDYFLTNVLIPIPSSVLLLGTGILGLALLGWRRKSS